jgi:group I intron endonuclease
MVIYLTENLINGKKYIGKDSRNNPAYLGSGKYLHQAIKKYGRKNFKKTILEYCDCLESLNFREIYWLKKYNCVEDPMYYNMTDTITPCTLGRKDSAEVRYKKSQAQKLSYREGRQRSTGASFHKSRTPDSYKRNKETRAKISAKLKDMPKSELHKNGISAAKKGKSTGPRSTEARAKISAKQLKRPIIKCDPITAEELKLYTGITYVKQDGFNSHAVQNVLAGLAKTSGGFSWKYAK